MVCSRMLSPSAPFPPLPILDPSPRLSKHFISAASALFRERRFYSPFVFNTLRTPGIVRLPSTPRFPGAYALFGEKYGCGVPLQSALCFQDLPHSQTWDSLFFIIAISLNLAMNRGCPLTIASSIHSMARTRTDVGVDGAQHDAAKTVHFPAKTRQKRAFRCNIMSRRVDSGTHARTSGRSLLMHNAKRRDDTRRTGSVMNAIPSELYDDENTACHPAPLTFGNSGANPIKSNLHSSTSKLRPIQLFGPSRRPLRA
jgi:hypothetical protein